MEESMENIANRAKFMNEIWLNVQVTTLVYYCYGWTDFVPLVGDVVDITKKYRDAGVIK